MGWVVILTLVALIGAAVWGMVSGIVKQDATLTGLCFTTIFALAVLLVIAYAVVS